MGLTLGFFHGYLITMPGLIRSGIVFLATLCLIYESIGYEDDFSERVNYHRDYSSAFAYGLGYRQEVLNEFFMVALIICWFFSLMTLSCLLFIKEMKDWRNLNRFLHLGFGVFLLLAWVCGIAGMFDFRSHCCHVTNGLIYHQNATEGYSTRCRCFLTIKWKKGFYYRPVNFNRRYPIVDVTDLEFWHPMVARYAEEIIGAQTHDFTAHLIAHGYAFVLAMMYLVSFIIV